MVKIIPHFSDWQEHGVAEVASHMEAEKVLQANLNVGYITAKQLKAICPGHVW